MIVEFFGVPGGGKTRLLRQLVAAMPGASEALVTTRGAIARGALRFALKHPVGFFVWIAELCLYANGLFRYKLGLLLRSMAALVRAGDARRDSRLVFVDEGLLQRMLTVFDTPLTPRHVAFLLAVTPLPDLAIVVRGGGFERFIAASNRNNSPRVKGGEARLQAWMQNMRANAAAIRPLLEQRVRVIACDRDRSEAEYAAIRQSIEQLRGAV